MAHALDLVGERWALLVVRELLLGPRRFADLRSGLPGASPDVLSRRLRGLERSGVLRRRKLPPPAASKVYELTEWGRELEPIIVSLGSWGARSPAMSLDAPIGINSMVLALRTMFDPVAADGLCASYELRLGEDRFHIEVENGRFEISRGEVETPDSTIETDPDTLRSLVFGGASLSVALNSGEVGISGDRSSAARFFDLFSLPEPATSDSGVAPSS